MRPKLAAVPPAGVHIGRLRKTLNRGRARDPIRTVRGTGYAFDERFGSADRG